MSQTKELKTKVRSSISKAEFISRREVLLKGGKGVRAPGNIADHFPMFIRRQDFVRYLSRYELFKLILNVKGSIVEGGVRYGSSLMLFAHLSSIYEPHALSRKIIGFDMFEGIIQNDGKKDDKDAFPIGRFSESDIDFLKECIALYDMARLMGGIQKIQLVKGDATKTIPKFFKENPYVIVALLYLDFNLYAPTKTAYDVIIPRMPKGAVIAFDELNSKECRGETLALLDSIGVSKLKIRKIPIDPYVSYAILE